MSHFRGCGAQKNVLKPLFHNVLKSFVEKVSCGLGAGRDGVTQFSHCVKPSDHPEGLVCKVSQSILGAFKGIW